MAKQRGPDGIPVDIPSIAPAEQIGEEPTAPPQRQSLFVGAEKTTKPMTGAGRGESEAGPASADEPRTMVASGWRLESEGMADEAGLTDPVVGWLAVVSGPGKGASMRLGNGQNSIGRGEGSRVHLNFGDRRISRNDHAVLTYDPRSNRFFIQQGRSVNLVYLNEEPVLAPTPLPNGSRITVGETILRFVALCGDEFTW